MALPSPSYIPTPAQSTQNMSTAPVQNMSTAPVTNMSVAPAGSLSSNIKAATTNTAAITSSPAKAEQTNISGAVEAAKATSVIPQTSAVPLGTAATSAAMATQAEQQMKDRVTAASQATPGTLQTGAQTGKTADGTPITYQAYTQTGGTGFKTPSTEPHQASTAGTDIGKQFVYDAAKGGYVEAPAGATGTTATAGTTTTTQDAGMALLDQQKTALDRQLEDQKNRINASFDQQARSAAAAYETTKGATSMQLARMGAFQTAASGVAYMNKLENQFNSTLQQIESERQSAIFDAENLNQDGQFKLAWQRLEYADKLKQDAEAEKEKYLKNLVTMASLESIQMDLNEKRQNSAVSLLEGAMAGGSTFDEVKDYAMEVYGIDEGTAASIWNLAAQANEKAEQETYDKQITQAKNLIDIADKMGTGVEIPLGGFTYTYQGFNSENTVGGTETDANGNTKYWTLDKRTGDTKTYDLGIVKKQDGWSTVNLGENGVWAVNPITGESKPFFASTGQQTWDNDVYATGQTGPALPGSPNAGQCGAMTNFFYGKGVVGDSLKSKIDPLSKYAVTSMEEVQPGMTFVQKMGSTGHIGFIEDVGIDPTNGKPYFTAFESNYKGDGKISHGRKMYFDDPSLALISDYPAPKLPAVGSDAPTILKEGKTAAETKPLSASELKTFTDLGYEVTPGMTMDDVRGLKKTAGGKSLEIPVPEDFARDIQAAMGQSLAPEKIQEMYSMTVGKMQPIADASEVITTGMTAAAAKATTSAINKALERGDIIGAQQQLKAAAISSLPSTEATKVRGREVGIEVLQGIQKLLQEYKQAGGDTGIISGTEEEMRAKIGKVKDPEKRKIASQIRTSLIDYRQSVSGAAFTESEMEEYKGLFPSISSTYELNQAKIDGLVRAWSSSNEAIFRQIMTPSLYEQIWQ